LPWIPDAVKVVSFAQNLSMKNAEVMTIITVTNLKTVLCSIPGENAGF
jgi:hypothetical protein